MTERTCKISGCDATTEDSKYTDFCGFTHYQKEYRKRKRAEKKMAEPAALAGFVIVDLRRKVAIGPFKEEDEGVRFMVQQGHDEHDLLATIATTPDVWVQTGEKAA